MNFVRRELVEAYRRDQAIQSEIERELENQENQENIPPPAYVAPEPPVANCTNQAGPRLNAAFANMLTSLDNMGNQVLAMQAQATATATTTAQMAKISKLLADPGPFEGSMSKFEEWWAKVKAWQAENHLAMPANTDKPVHAVLSRLEGPKAGSFASMRLEILNSGTAYTGARMCGELEELFRPANQKDWARKKLRELKQGRMMIDEWIIKFQTYSQATQLNQGQLVDIIEQNIDSSIIRKIIEEDTRPTNPADYLTKVRNISQKRQLTRFLGIAGPSRQQDPNAMDINALDEESEMEIDAFTRGKGKVRIPTRNRKLITCFNCRKPGHMAKECKIPST